VGSTHGGHNRWAALAPVSALVTFACLTLHSNGALAQEAKAATPAAGEPAYKGGGPRTRGGAQVKFTSLKDWNLKAENLSPRGRNPYYFPLEPGFRYIMERADHPWGKLHIEVKVLDKTEPFDVPGIGKFDCAVVQEEEYYDEVLGERAENWYCIDKSNNNMYNMGEVTWEIDHLGRKIFGGTWRVGEPDGNGVADPGLLMPNPFIKGAKYVFDGHEAEAYGYTENMETGITITVRAGTFKDCVRTREYSLTNPSNNTVDSWWCPGVGIVKDTLDGELVASDVLPNTDMSQFGKLLAKQNQTTPPVPKVTGMQATEVALREVPGKVTSMKIERRGKSNVYAVEIIAQKDGVETDVFVDIESGKVVGTVR
jgi:Peptidase propeptide and YPEB domain